MKISNAFIKSALREDLPKSDVTTHLLIDKNSKSIAYLICKEDGVICGLGIAKSIFGSFDKGVRFQARVKDGKAVKKGDISIAEIALATSST